MMAVIVGSPLREARWALCLASLAFAPTLAIANDPSTIAAPASITMYEDMAASISGISVGDADGDTLDIELTGENLQLSIFRMTGTVAELNAALATLTAIPYPDYSGSTTLLVHAVDGLHWSWIEIPVNVIARPPEISLPPVVNLDEDTTVAIPIGLDQVDGEISVYIYTQYGSVTPTAVFGEASVVLAEFSEVQFTPDSDFSGQTSLRVEVFDSGQHVAETTISVKPVPPEVLHPLTPIALVENTPLSIPFEFAHIDGEVEVHFYSFDNVSVSPASWWGDATTIANGLSNVELLSVGDDFSGPASFWMLIYDGGHVVRTDYAVDVASAPPELTLPVGLKLPAEVQSAIPGLGASSIDGQIHLILEVDVGQVIPEDAWLTEAESAASVLSSATYTPPVGYLGPVTLRMWVVDGPHTVGADTTIWVVASPPVLVPSLGWAGLLASVAALLVLGKRTLARHV